MVPYKIKAKKGFKEEIGIAKKYPTGITAYEAKVVNKWCDNPCHKGLIFDNTLGLQMSINIIITK